MNKEAIINSGKLTHYLNKRELFTVLYDGSCPLCTDASSYATRLLTQNKHKVIRFSIQKVFEKEIDKNDEFLLVYNGEIYSSHEAWLKIFENSKAPWKWAKYVSRIKPAVWMIKKLYQLVSKYRKVIYKKKTGCNCG